MMRKLIFAAMMLASSQAFALDPLCTTTTNLGMHYCPAKSLDWYQSYTDIVNNLDWLAQTAPSTFTVSGSTMTIGGATGVQLMSPAANVLQVNGKIGANVLPGGNAQAYSKNGNSNGTFAFAGFQYSSAVSSSTKADTTEIVAASTGIPAGVLANNGDCLIIACGGAGAATATTKRMVIRWNGTTLSSTNGTALADTGAVTSNNVLLNAMATICKSNSNAQVVRESFAQAAGTIASQPTTPALTATDTGVIIVSCDIKNGTGNLADTVENIFTIEKLPAP